MLNQAIQNLSNSELRDAKRKAEIWWRAQQVKNKATPDNTHRLQEMKLAFNERVAMIDAELDRRQQQQLGKQTVNQLT